MASENLQIDENGRNVLGGVTNDASEFIKNLRVNPITGRLIVDAHLTSTNTEMGDTIPGGTAGSILFLGLGSTLAQDNANLFYDDTNNFVGFGTNTPDATLEIDGTFHYVDGNEANSFVLISDVSGNASWGNLAINNTFVNNLIANTTFTTNLANNSNFITTLANNNTFITDLTSNSTFISDITSITINNGAITVQDEGTPLTTAAGTLNFVGAGVTATGAGTTKTITITGGSGGGTVTSVSVVSANGLAGTVATATTTPAITLSTTVTGIIKGNGTAMSAASAGTDYVAPGSITSDGITMSTARLLGRTTASTGAVEEITVGSGLSLSGGSLTATGGTSTVFSITQTAHGFAIGDVIRPTTAQWTKSLAVKTSNTDLSSEAYAIVLTVPGANSFTAQPLDGSRITTAGVIALLAGFAGGAPIYLSDSVAGTFTDAEPTTAGSVSKPIGYVETDSGSAILAFTTVNYRGLIIGTNGNVVFTNSTTTKDSSDASTVQTIAHGLGAIPSQVTIKMTSAQTSANTFMFADAVYNGTTQSSQSLHRVSGGYSNDSTFRLNANSNTNDYNEGVITFDDTNIYITWTKVGSTVTGIYQLLWTAQVDESNVTNTTYTNGSTTRLDNAAGSTQNIPHGLGVIPKKIKITANLAEQFNVWGIMQSIGVYNGTTVTTVWFGEHISSGGASITGLENSNIIYLQTESTVILSATVTFDATNIILVWSAGGSASGRTAQIMWEAEA